MDCRRLIVGGDCTGLKVGPDYRMFCEDHWVGIGVGAVAREVLGLRMRRAVARIAEDIAASGYESLRLLVLIRLT